LLSEAVLAHVCPRLPAGQRPRIVAALTRAFDGSSITTAPRLAAFLAQAAHESSEFRLWQELWGPTAQQRKYEPPSVVASNLGNTHPGDGYRYRGRGPFQLTGRRNYRHAGERLGWPLEEDPDLVDETDVGCLVAVDFWETRALTPLADLGTADGFRAITRRINGGVTSLPQREAYHTAARSVLGLPDVRSDAR
jgi:putative chitinase